jgi:hypothetical protein
MLIHVMLFSHFLVVFQRSLFIENVYFFQFRIFNMTIKAKKYITKNNNFEKSPKHVSNQDVLHNWEIKSPRNLNYQI